MFSYPCLSAFIGGRFFSHVLRERPCRGITHYTGVMRNRILLALVAALVGCCLLAGSPQTTTTKPPATKKKPAKKKTKRPSAPRAGAHRKLEEYLADAAQKASQHPGALVPFFEQLVRLGAAADKTPVHIIQFGDSHTAADE